MQVRLGEHHELALAGAGGERGRAVEVVLVSGEHRRGDEERSRGRGRGSREDLVGGERVATDEAVQERGLVSGHGTTVRAGADDALTAADGARSAGGPRSRDSDAGSRDA